MRYREIMEKRKSRDLDKNVLDELKNYVNNGHYMSYTVIDKLGLNPRSGYETPVGIYSYPIIDSIHKDIERNNSLDAVPYMGQAPYVWIFKPKNSQRGLYLSEYVQEDEFFNDVKKLKKYCVEEKGMSEKVFGLIYDEAFESARKKGYNSYIWNFTRLLSIYLGDYKNKSEWKDAEGNSLDIGTPVRILNDTYFKYRAGIIKSIDSEFERIKVYFPYIDDFYDKSWWFGYNEVTKIDESDFQEYINFIKTKKFKVSDEVKLDNLDNRTYLIKNINWFEKEITLSLDESIIERTVSFDEFYSANPEYKPNINENAIIKEYEENNDVANSQSILWTYLLYRVLGYDFVDDSEGIGIIHDNEPVQAVFFNRAVIDVVDRFVNPARRDINPFTNDNNTAKDFDNMDNSIITKWAKYYMKNNINISSVFKEHWKKSIPIKSSKLQAQLIISDIDWKDYIRDINPDTIKILDRYYIKQIENTKSLNRSRSIWNHFKYFHDNDWPEGEQALFNKITSEGFHGLAYEYIQNTRMTRWPKIEPYILKSPQQIYHYTKTIIKERWPEGEKELINMYNSEDRPSVKEYIFDLIRKYSNLFNINLEDSID